MLMPFVDQTDARGLQEVEIDGRVRGSERWAVLHKSLGTRLVQPPSEPSRLRDHYLILLLPLPRDIPFLLLAPELRRALPLELVPVNRQLVLDGDRVIHPH
jgi:hypothetical protein